MKMKPRYEGFLDQWDEARQLRSPVTGEASVVPKAQVTDKKEPKG